MASGGMPTLPSFDVHSDPPTVSQRWEKWLKRFEGAMVGFNITAPKRKRALLFHYGGDDLSAVFDTLPDTGDDNDYDKAKQCLSNHFNPKKNPIYETILFRDLIQNSEETVDQYCTRLRQAALNCEFHDLEREILTQIIIGCKSKLLRRKALENKEHTLSSLLELARSLEMSEQRASAVEASSQCSQSTSVNTIDTRSDTRRGRARARSKKASHTYKPKSQQRCDHCGYSPHRKNQGCPAKGQTCKCCNKRNHFASVCRSTEGQSQARGTTSGPKSKESRPKAASLANVRESSPSDAEDVFAVQASPHPHAKVHVDGAKIDFIVDTGCRRNIVDEPAFRQIQNGQTIKLQKSKVRLYPYGCTTPLKILGKFSVLLESNQRMTTEEVFVVKGNSGSLLGRETAQKLGLVTIKDTLPEVNNVSSTETSDCSEWETKFPEVFSGIGKLKDVQVKLHIDPSVPPVAQRHRKVPLRKKVEQQLLELEKQDVIEDATGPTPWVSPVIAVPKPHDPDKIRLCVDMRAANKAIKRERHGTPTTDEIIAELNGSSVFSKVDLRSGYHQLEISPESRYITTFATHVGLKRYKRLSFGISSASEVFQNTIRQVIEGIPGVLNVSDDILIHAPTREEHDKRLHALFTRLSEKGLTLNGQKCEFAKSSIQFFGLVFGKDGVSPDPSKVDAIKNAPPPQSAAEVRSLLGMASYSARFIPNLSTVTEPLRALIEKNVKFVWTDEHDRALQQLKDSLSAHVVGAYFDTNKHSQLIVDASPVGLGAVLAQTDEHGNCKVVSYASRSLTPTEQRYSQIEREALAITWAVTRRYHMYLYGRPFTVVTDHKPLIPIFSKHSSNPSPRIQNWLLKVQPYDMKVVHCPGKDNPADYMSRHPGTSNVTDDKTSQAAEEFINFVAHHATPKAITLDHIRTETAKDVALQATINAYRSNRWYTLKDTYHAMWAVRDAISVTDDDIVLKDNRIVIPSTLQQRTLELAHRSHQGITKTKSLLRQKVWFANIDKRAEETVKSCMACQTATFEQKREPLQMTDLPAYPWQQVCLDFGGPFPSGDYLLVCIDVYSRYPIVEIVRSTSAQSTIPRLDKIFAEHGTPEVVTTDNGPPFNSSDFKAFSEYLGFRHRKITPHWPEANGQAENFMKSLKKAVQTIQAEGNNWKQELWTFLRAYRSTPHTSTGIPPATARFGRNINTPLPQVHKHNATDTATELSNNNKRAKQRQKQYADKRRHAKPSVIKVGDKVLVKNYKRSDKTVPPYHREPYTVTRVNGPMITASLNNHTVTRNSSHMKRIDSHTPLRKGEESACEVKRPRPVRAKKVPSYLKDYELQT